MGQYGISGVGLGTKIDQVLISNSGSGGILIGSGLISHCQVLYNGGVGIGAISDGGLVRNSFIDGNKSVGLSLNAGWGYVQNVLQGNNGIPAGAQTSGGLNLAQNQCGATACPGASF